MWILLGIERVCINFKVAILGGLVLVCRHCFKEFTLIWTFVVSGDRAYCICFFIWTFVHGYERIGERDP